MGTPITLVCDGKNDKGRYVGGVTKFPNMRFVHCARRLAKHHSEQFPGNWAEVICGDREINDYSEREWYEHYEGGKLVVEKSKLMVKS